MKLSVAAVNGDLLKDDSQTTDTQEKQDDFSHCPANGQDAALLMNTNDEYV